MAASKTSVDNAVNERRLRPIYDWLDNGNNKKALQEAAKLLKKQETFLCAKVLKALALIRLGKSNESIPILQEVHSECPADETTLQAMTICYWELHKPELIAEAYENASKKDPNNEEFLTHLFMAYVRLGHYKKQQLTAMTLYKVKPKNPYYFWAVMSIVMQAHSSDSQLAKSMFLPLAQKMTEKLVGEDKIEAEAEVELYLEILKLQGKYEEALNVLKGPLAAHLKTCTTITRRQAFILEHLERWNEAHIAFQQLLLSNPDDWECYKGYFKSLFKIIGENAQPESKNWLSDNYACDASKFILGQINQGKSHNLRGPLLARLEFLRELKLHGNDLKGEEQLAGTFLQLLIEYYDRFGSKMCCFKDLRPYIDYLSETDKKKFLELLEEKVSASKDTEQFPNNPKELQYHIGYIQVSRYLGQHLQMSTNQKFDLVDDLIKTYKCSLKFNDDLPETDVHPGSDYCILAVHVLVDLWKQSGDENILLKAIIYLECGLVHSPLNHQFKLLLIKLYHKIGAIVPAHHCFNSMDIKHVQLDTIGYFITRYLTSFSYYSVACTVYGNTLRFFTSSYKDIVDYLIASYKFGSFKQIFEFIQFRDRLNSSQQFGMVSIERMILDLVVDTRCHEATEQVVLIMGVDPEKEKISTNSLIDNRDLNIMSSWDSNGGGISLEESCTDEVNWLKLRQLLIRSVTAGVLLTHCQNSHKTISNEKLSNGVNHDTSNTFQSLVESYSAFIKTLNVSSVSAKWSLTGPYESRLLLYLQDEHPSIILDSLNLLLFLQKSSEQQKINESINEQLMCSELPSRIQLLTNQCINKVESIKCASEFSCSYEVLTNLVETLSILLICFGCCQRIVKPYKISLSRKGKKRNRDYVPPNASDFVETFENNVNTVEQSLKDVNQLILRLKTTLLAERLSSLNVCTYKEDSAEELREISKPVQEKICESYQTSLTELENLIQHKTKYLFSIKL